MRLRRKTLRKIKRKKGESKSLKYGKNERKKTMDGVIKKERKKKKTIGEKEKKEEESRSKKARKNKKKITKKVIRKE